MKWHEDATNSTNSAMSRKNDWTNVQWEQRDAVAQIKKKKHAVVKQA